MADALPTALLLDLDDTILSDSADAALHWERVCALHASDIAPHTPAELVDAINAYRAWYWSDPERHRTGRMDLLTARTHTVTEALHSLGVTGDHAATLARDIGQKYSDLREASLEPLPGALEAVDTLRERGQRLALLTNGAALVQRRKIERYDLARHFELILIEGEFGCGKPDPRVYQHALDALALEPERVWMVGDNLEWDVLAPQRLGIAGVWVNPAGRPLPDGVTGRPFRVVSALADLAR